MNNYNIHYFKYYALDKNLNNPRDITHLVESGKVSYNSLSRLKASCTLSLSLSTDEVLDLPAVRIYSCMNGQDECIGTFFNKVPETTYDGQLQEISPTCYSTLVRLSSNSPSNRYYVPRGTNAVAEVKRILDSFGYNYDIPDNTKTTSTDKEFPLGEYYLDIINYLLDVVNYTSLYVDVYGNYVATPYELPYDREIDLELNENDIDNIIEPVQKHTLDTLNIPNKFIRYCSSDPQTDLFAVYEYTDGPTGTMNTWTNTDCQEVNDVADYDTLYAMCKKACAESTSIYDKVEVTIAFKMLPTYMPTVYLNHYQAKGKYNCTSFDMELETGGAVTLNLRKSVVIV